MCVRLKRLGSIGSSYILHRSLFLGPSFAKWIPCIHTYTGSVLKPKISLSKLWELCGHILHRQPFLLHQKLRIQSQRMRENILQGSLDTVCPISQTSCIQGSLETSGDLTFRDTGEYQFSILAPHFWKADSRFCSLICSMDQECSISSTAYMPICCISLWFNGTIVSCLWISTLCDRVSHYRSYPFTEDTPTHPC